ncbi:MAG: hypothetical protein LBD03_03180 [Methanobrevibacter sp.]|nr:hypothetical protein [Candidatus Methanovirga procula]
MKSKLSVDESNFKKLITGNTIYIDKTEIINNLLDLKRTYHFYLVQEVLISFYLKI